MILFLRYLVRISRPRFWIYGLGPYILGLGYLFQVGYADMIPWWIFIVFGVFFTFPANLLVYGVNDIFDRNTDSHNPKKDSYEQRLPDFFITPLIIAITVSVLPFIILAGIFLPLFSFITLLVGIFFLITYSAPPLRTKSLPLLDGVWNGIMSLFGAFFIISIGALSFPWIGLLAGFFWASAFHAYSAVPDIFYDKQANISTTATLLGERPTLMYVFMLMILATIMGSITGGSIVFLLGLCYLAIIGLTNYRPKDIMKHYKVFPFLNFIVGMVLFFVVLMG